MDMLQVKNKKSFNFNFNFKSRAPTFSKIETLEERKIKVKFRR